MPNHWYRIQYRKGGDLVYLSHLDLLRVLERALRRSGLPLAWREGFNPRPRLSLGPALPLGAGGEAEVLAIALAEPAAEAAIAGRLGAELPEGLAIGEVRPGRDLPGEDPGRWRLELASSPPPAPELAARLAALGTVPDARGRPVVLSASVRDLAVAGCRLEATLANQGGRPVRPRLLAEALGLGAPLKTTRLAVPAGTADAITETKEINDTYSSDQRGGSGGAPGRDGRERPAPGDPHRQPLP